jgi:hypothetical protein
MIAADPDRGAATAAPQLTLVNGANAANEQFNSRH